MVSSFTRSTGLHSLITTPPQTRKRKALADTGQKEEAKPTAKRIKTAPPAPLNTPPLTTMDSEDDFMSGQSSGDEGFAMEQDSDDGSVGDGKSSCIHRINLALADASFQTLWKKTPTLAFLKKI